MAALGGLPTCLIARQRGDGLGWRLSELRHSAEQCGVANPRLVRQLRERYAFAVDRDPHRAATIPDLRTPRCPLAIRRLVMSIGIDAINRGAWKWLRPHIAKKRGEVSAPFVAHMNATTAVVRILRHAWVVAAILHVLPSAVLRSYLTTLGLSVLEVSGGHGFIVKASATSRVATTEQVTGYDANSAACAPAPPLGLNCIHPRSRQDSQSAERLTDNVYESHIANCITMAAHGGLSG